MSFAYKEIAKAIASSKYFRIGSYFLSFGLVILVAYFTYFHNYSYPADFFWDEQYHIPNAQKYLNGIFFMEPHPPLGKLLIALGEKIVHANMLNDQYRDTDFSGNVGPIEKFSFAGYRLFPALLAWFTAPLVFTVFLVITNSQIPSLLLTSLYLFDNATIVHARGAMLDSTLLFFTSSAFLAFLLLLKYRERHYLLAAFSVLFGLSFGLAVTTKVTGLILLLLMPAVLWEIWRDWKQSLVFLSCAAAAFLVAFVTVWQIHFSLAVQVNPTLTNNGYFDASAEYKQILESKRTDNLLFFPTMLRDSLAYIPNYNKNVPKLNLCDIKDGGSPAFLWPLGARTINYRWESPDGFLYRYLYLQSNPIAWAVGLLGILITTSMLVGSLTLPISKKLQHRLPMAALLVMYLGYMFVMLNIKRTMYLYHYFPPLLFSYFMFGLVFAEIEQFGQWLLSPKTKVRVLAVLAIAIFMSFQFYRPLTYYEPLTDVAFRKRVLFPLWNLRCINCEPSKLIWEAKES